MKALTLVLAVALLVGCGEAAPPPATDVATTTTESAPTTVAPTTTIEIVETAAVSHMPAVRVDPPEPPPAPFDCAAYVNGIAYQVNDPEPARLAYRITAACRGWDEATIARWERFIVDDVMKGESRYCWNVRGGAEMTGSGCEMSRQGRKEDSGIMQLIGLWYHPGGPLCVATGMCSSAAIIASPWSSFTAGLFAIEYDGKGPWCYDAWARGFHPTCAITPRRWP